MSLLRRRARARSCDLHGDNGCELQGEAGRRDRAQDSRGWRRDVQAELIPEDDDPPTNHKETRMTTTSPHLPGPVPAWYSTLHDIAYDDGAPEDVREAAVEAITAYGALRQDRRELYTATTGMSKSDLVNRAIQVYNFLQTVETDQGQLLVHWPDGNTKQVQFL